MPKSANAHTTSPVQPFSAKLPSALLNALDVNNRITKYLIENLPAEACNAKPPERRGRTITAIVAHIHNVRVMWLKAAKTETVPDQLDRRTVTPKQATSALEDSCKALCALIARALETDGRIKNFRPDVAGFFGYLIAHDAHHRGQIAMLARQLGHALRQKTIFGMWDWGSW